MEHLPTLVQRQIESTQSGVPDGFVTDENGRFVPFWYTRVSWATLQVVNNKIITQLTDI